MNTNTIQTTEKTLKNSNRYAKCVEVSKRIRWEIEGDVIRGREFDFTNKFLPDGLSLLNDMIFLTEEECRLLSQIQGRTYANIFGLVERFINTKILEVSRDHALGDQSALEAMIRFSDEELKHQALFRRIENMIAKDMPEGYNFAADANEVASAVLSKSTWAVLGLTCHIELFTQAHYRESIEADEGLSDLFKDVFLFHWREESQHAIIDELEWRREDEKLNDVERDQAITDFIDLVVAVDGILQGQSEADASYFCMISDRTFSSEERNKVQQGLLRAYRWQYILSGAEVPQFTQVLGDLINEEQGKRIADALGTLI
ncbi:MAG: hypothetical protein DIZ80_16810 [endosymbiont of Galathealinum brachiosum]|uniref:Uncharacterized protein n=1 Tax=endosymbiont of Galathealinum brachiosum TaxID=2200906 RepID=A0A370D6N6_9GAMM|nr:MAG: hypothetical protein DIZ80_16810 [endosymbiont of Galathealinum brachiosum]